MNGPIRISRRRILQAATIMPFDASAPATAADGLRNQATFVLVHGGFHGGWCYARVATILRARGHRVFTPTLTGLGERSHLANLGIINCTTHINDIVNVIKWEQLYNVVLCGHSYGCTVIGGVADTIPERIASLVYIDGLIPQNDQSALGASPPHTVFERLNAVAEYGSQMMLPPFPAEFFNVNQADRAMVDALSTPQPFATFVERLKLTGAYMNIPKKTYILATNWEVSFCAEYARIKDDKGWVAIKVPYGHDVMLDAPEHLAEILSGVTPS